ncbi:MAG: serine protease [Pseudomonadota bacterium]
MFAADLGERGIAFISGRDSAIDFLRERGNRASQTFDVAQVVMIHPWWDMAMLKVPGLGAMHPPLALDPKAADDLIGREVAVIGYPAFDRRNPADVQARVFDNVYAVKRLQPGKLRGRADVESFDRTQRVPTHDASTLGGNSGSCVVDLQSGHVVGLHFAGIYLKANFCVTASDLALDSRVIDTGVVLANDPTPTAGGWTKAWIEADRAGSDEPAQAPGAQTTTPTVPPAAGAVIQPAPPAPPPAVTGPAGSVNLTIPLHISVSLGTLAPAAGPASVVAAPTAPTAPTIATSPEQQLEQPPKGKPFWDPDYTTRRGFDTDFLGIPVPLPTPRNPHEISQAPGGGPYLHYHHFSLAMHK